MEYPWLSPPAPPCRHIYTPTPPLLCDTRPLHVSFTSTSRVLSYLSCFVHVSILLYSSHPLIRLVRFISLTLSWPRYSRSFVNPDIDYVRRDHVANLDKIHRACSMCHCRCDHVANRNLSKYPANVNLVRNNRNPLYSSSKNDLPNTHKNCFCYL